MNTFQKALQFTLKWEGGFSNHKNDSGGHTNYGVTQGTYNIYRRLKNLPKKDVRLITQEEVSDVYYTLYWLSAKCPSFSDKIAIAVFDFAVNSGVSRALKKLQQLVRTEVDGKWGPKSRAAYEEHLREFGEDELVQQYLRLRRNFFHAIAKGKNHVFLKGWLNRLNDLIKFLLN